MQLQHVKKLKVWQFGHSAKLWLDHDWSGEGFSKQSVVTKTPVINFSPTQIFPPSFRECKKVRNTPDTPECQRYYSILFWQFVYWSTVPAQSVTENGKMIKVLSDSERLPSRMPSGNVAVLCFELAKTVCKKNKSCIVFSLKPIATEWQFFFHVCIKGWQWKADCSKHIFWLTFLLSIPFLKLII